MNGAHDLGGMDGFGAVDHADDRHFPEQWERTVFALTMACGLQGKWNLDQSRFARERMDPAHYLGSSYYEHWLHGIETLLVEQGMVTAEELESGRSNPAASFTPVAAQAVPAILAKGGPVSMDTDIKPRYQVGDLVQMHNQHPAGHTRLPRYIRGRSGKVITWHGAHIFPDRHAADATKEPAHLYTVAFSAAEIWGASETGADDEILIDVFEPYIESGS